MDNITRTNLDNIRSEAKDRQNAAYYALIKYRKVYAGLWRMR